MVRAVRAGKRKGGSRVDGKCEKAHG